MDALSSTPTLHIFIAAYLSNCDGAGDTIPDISFLVDDVAEDILVSIWKDYISNINLSLQAIMSMRDDAIAEFTNNPAIAETVTPHEYITTLLSGKPIRLMDMHDILASIALVCCAVWVKSSRTQDLLLDFSPVETERDDLFTRVMRAYMTDILLLFMKFSENAMQAALSELGARVVSLTDDALHIANVTLPAELDEPTKAMLRKRLYSTLESLDAHADEIGTYLDEIRDSITNESIAAIYLKDFRSGPPPPHENMGGALDGLFTLWFWVNYKLDYLNETVTDESEINK